MRIGNLPKDRGELLEGKTYWSLAIGRHALVNRMWTDGWRAFEFVVYKPFHDPYEEGKALPTRFRFAFAYWLPFYSL